MMGRPTTQFGLRPSANVHQRGQHKWSCLSDRNVKSQRDIPQPSELSRTVGAMPCLIRNANTCGGDAVGHRAYPCDDSRVGGDRNSNSCGDCACSEEIRVLSSANSEGDPTCGCVDGGGSDDRTRVQASGAKSEVTRRHRRRLVDVQVEDHRQELSMLTVLLALLAIARSKCLLLSSSPPLARSSLSAVALVCVVLFVCTVAPVTASLSPSREGKLCGSIDIRNSVQQFKDLEDCVVVEGFVQILLIDHADESNYTNLSFPKLREITGYLMLYRANGLRSIGALFPNLAVIRGNTLFYNYALLTYEMQHLQEIGLHSLTDIVRGSVRFEKNPLLCYVDTVDWDVIAKTGKNEHFIKGPVPMGNRLKNECPTCPSVIANVTCPKASTGESSNCWNRHYCQKVCPKECPRSCDINGDCCNENCLGGCRHDMPKNISNCFVCKDVKYNGTCIKECPLGTFEYLKRRCVLEDECYKIKVIDDHGIPQNTTWKPFNGTSCILDCPPGYEEKANGTNHLKCVVCNGPCRKECQGGTVDSIAAAQNLRGCTYIKGSLEIQITGGKNIVKELEDNLNIIEEIEGYLKVVRSFPLISLNFLKNLRIIHGMEKLDGQNNASLLILDNQNLQELWNDTQLEKFEIRRGRIFLHSNPKLCMYKIKKLSHAIRLDPPFTEPEVSKTNGDKIACNVTELIVWARPIAPTAAVIEWAKFEHYDMRSLLGYVVYTIEAPYNNLTIYDGRDACGTDGWIVDDVSAEPESKSDNYTQLMTNLKPYTQYAYYVKTYMIATEDSGAQSPIKYFKTYPDVPSMPQLLTVVSNSSTELVIKWLPPVTPNGDVTHYIITGFKDGDEFLGERNYCDEPITNIDQLLRRPAQDEDDDKTTPNPNSCPCDEKTDNTLQQDEIDQKVLSIHFEDFLHNQIYVKRADSGTSRKRRSIAGNEGKFGDGIMLDGTWSHPPPANNIAEDYAFKRIVHNSTMAVISGLHHYGLYTIRVQACRALTAQEKDKKNFIENCSKTSIVSGRTRPLEGADDVGMVHIEMTNTSLGMVKLMWDEPPKPNGIIVAYHIEYRRMDIENYKPLVECITQAHYLKNDKSYTLVKLLPGNYSVHVRATSLRDNGNYTPVAYFLIKEANTSSVVELLVGCLVGLFAVLVACGIVFYLRRKHILGMPKGTLIADVNPEYMSTVYIPDEWEVPRKKIELLKELGQGSFGMVYEGIGHDIADQREMRCAIKTVGEHATDRERSEFLNEASVMKAFHTHHVVQLLGVVSIDQPVLVVMELMTHGDLKTYLRSHRPNTGGDHSIQPPTLKRILQMAIEIADGMAYLSAKKFVHRDLAARNCMVAEDLTVKIGDFGMTRDIYETDYYRKGTKGLLPVRWMAPESLKDGIFSSRSDVWSYGVVLWEMATLASQPYQGLSNDQVLRYVIDNGVMERPENCPDRLYDLMHLCWQHKPLVRPPFLDLVTILLNDVPADFSQVSFYHSKEGCEVRAHLAEASAAAEDDPATPLRITRDIEDFSLGGSDLDEDEEPFEVTAHSPSTSYPLRFGSIATTQHQPLLPGNEHVVVSLSSNGSKLGNGSAVTSPTTANGWVVSHQNGTDTSSAQKTTEC